MYQAIVTKFLGPTNHKGSRIKAKCEAGQLTVAWDYAKDTGGNHKAAAQALLKQLGWDDRPFFGGALPTNDGYAFVHACDLSAVKPGVR